jgi:hypothetical protein
MTHTKDEAKAATPHHDLIAELLNPNIPKTEREHAASREIERLQALASTVQKPVAWAIYQQGRLQSFWLDKGDAYDFEFTTEHQWQPLYTTPPAQRQWVGLTTAGVEEIALNHVTEVSECCKAIKEAEAKLRKENT